jgi:hypothetical protein
MKTKVSVILTLNLAWLIAACGGASSPMDSTGTTEEAVSPAPYYKNPLRGIQGLTPERIDQGVDYAGSGPLYSLGNGTVVEVFNSGWPGGAFIAVRLSDGPAAGQVVYEAENITPHVSVGQSVTADTVLGTLIDASPNLEIGWGSPVDIGESYWAQLNGVYPDNCNTSFGLNFNQLLVALGAPSGVAQGSNCSGGLPSGFPSWSSSGKSCSLGGHTYASNTCTETKQCDNGTWVARTSDPSACTTGVEPGGACITDTGTIDPLNTCTSTLQCDNGVWVDRTGDPAPCDCALAGHIYATNTCTETKQCDDGSWVARSSDPSACLKGIEPNGACITDTGAVDPQNTCTSTLQCDDGVWVARSTDPSACL